MDKTTNRIIAEIGTIKNWTKLMIISTRLLVYMSKLEK